MAAVAEQITAPELRFPMFHNTWKEQRLGDLTTKVGSGSTPLGGKSTYESSGVLFIRSQNVNQGQLLLDDVAFVSNEIHESMQGSRVICHDVLLNITGASIGRSCVYSLVLEANVNQHVCIIRSSLNSRFLHAWLQGELGQSEIFRSQEGGGREGLNFKSIRNFRLRIPSNDEQQKIAEFLTAVDERIAKLKRKKELLEEYKRGMMQKLFSQEIRFKDEDGTDFPDWEERRLGEVAKIGTGNRDRVDSSDQGVYRFFDRSEDVRYMSEFDHEGEVVVVPGEGQSFKSTFYSGKYSLHQRVYGITNFDGVLAKWVFYLVVVDQKHFLSQAVGTTVKSLRTPIFVKWTIPVPSIGEQQKITDCLTGLDDKITTVANQIDKAAEFKRGLLQKMFV